MIKLIVEKPVELIGNDEVGIQIVVNHKRYVRLFIGRFTYLLRRGKFSTSPVLDLTREELKEMVNKIAPLNLGWELLFPNNEVLRMNKRQVSHLQKLLTN